RENLVVIAIVFRVSRTAVDTAEVAAVRDGDAQVGDLAAEFVVKDHVPSHSLDAIPSYQGATAGLKQGCPIQCWNRARTEKVLIFGVIAPFQARETWVFPPKPSAPIVSRDVAPAAVGYLSARLPGSELRT